MSAQRLEHRQRNGGTHQKRKQIQVHDYDDHDNREKKNANRVGGGSCRGRIHTFAL